MDVNAIKLKPTILILLPNATVTNRLIEITMCRFILNHRDMVRSITVITVQETQLNKCTFKDPNKVCGQYNKNKNTTKQMGGPSVGTVTAGGSRKKLKVFKRLH